MLMGILVSLLLGGDIFGRGEKVKGRFRLGVMLNKVEGKFVKLKVLMESSDVIFKVLIDSDWKLNINIEIFENSVCFVNW